MLLRLTEDQIKSVTELISNSTHIVVTAHKNPDGDAVGSVLALHLFLKSLGKKVSTILPDSVPDFLQWMPSFNEIIIHEENRELAKQKIAGADVIFSLDYNVLSRVGREMQDDLEATKATFVLIDHHQQPGNFAKIIFSDTSACSTCEMLYHFIVDCFGEDKLDVAIAECLYCGIMTDSGSFRFDSVTQDTHRIVGNLIALGLDHAKVHREVYDTNLLERLQLIGYALSEKLEIISDSATAFIWLSSDELHKFSYRQGDTEGLVNQALSVKGVKLAAFFRGGGNEVKISFRSKGKFDVNRFARDFWNGGGHRNAAGASSALSMEDTLSKFRELVENMKAEIINS